MYPYKEYNVYMDLPAPITSFGDTECPAIARYGDTECTAIARYDDTRPAAITSPGDTGSPVNTSHSDTRGYQKYPVTLFSLKTEPNYIR
jgi:hypothetical protein